MPERARHLLWLGLVIVAAVVLRAATLQTGLHMDDLAQRAMVDGGYPAVRPWWDLYRFSGLSPEANGSLMSAGALPWWSHPQLRLSAFRPLASALVWVDVKIGSTTFAHVHSMVWWVGLLAVGYRVVRRTLGHRWALLAVALYAFDDCHIYPLAWLANRAATISILFGLLAFEAHVRWRDAGWSAGRWWAPVFTALSLAAGEYGFAVFGFMLAFVVIAERGSWGSRIRGLSGPAAVAVAALAIARALGYGSAHSAVYVDPLRDPVGYLGVFVERWPLLLTDMLTATPLGLLQLESQSTPGLLLMAASVGVVGVLWLLCRAALTTAERRWIAVWVLGACLALLPVVSSFLSSRLTVVASLGTSVLIAGLVLGAGRRVAAVASRRRAVTWVALVAAVAFALSHLAGGAYWGRVDTQNLTLFNAASRSVAKGLDAPDDRTPKERWVLLSAGDPMMLIYPPIVRWLEGRPLPRSWWVLSMAPTMQQVTRVSDRALEYAVIGDTMMTTPIEQFFRHPDDPLQAGDVVELEGLHIEILEVAEGGGIRRVRFTFDRKLEHRSLRFFVLGSRGFVQYPIARVGSVMQIAPGAHPIIAAGQSG